MDFTNELRASNIIKERGIEGIYESALLAGMPTTLSMLLMQLDGDDSEKIKLVHEVGMNNLVDFCPASGHAVVYAEEKGLVAAFEITDGKCVDVPIKGLHVGMWMQGSPEVKSIFAGNPPYKEIKEIITREHHAYVEEQLAKYNIER